MNHIYSKSILKISAVSLLVLSAMGVFAQQDPYYTHFKFNKQSYNPAAAGEKEDFICFNGIAHYQWLNFDDVTLARQGNANPNQAETVVEDVAPETYAFNISTPIKLKNRSSIGVGLTFLNDKLGFLQTTSFRAQANYQIPIQGDFAKLSVGLDVGGTDFGYSQPRFMSLDQGDNHIPTSGNTQMKLDMGAGIYYTQKRLGTQFENFYAGLSVTHVNSPNYDINLTMQSGNLSNTNFDMVRHYYMVAGMDWELNPGWVLEPAVLLKFANNFSSIAARPQIDLNATVLYAETIRGGLGYRQWANTDALSLMLGYVKDEIQVGYSYDLTLSRIQQVSNNTHEIMVAYCFQVNPKVEPKDKLIRRTPRFL